MRKLVRALAFAITICATAYRTSHAVPIAPLTGIATGDGIATGIALTGDGIARVPIGAGVGAGGGDARSLCTIGSAFSHPIPFRNPRRLVKRFVSAPFLFAGR